MFTIQSVQTFFVEQGFRPDHLDDIASASYFRDSEKSRFGFYLMPTPQGEMLLTFYLRSAYGDKERQSKINALATVAQLEALLTSENLKELERALAFHTETGKAPDVECLKPLMKAKPR